MTITLAFASITAGLALMTMTAHHIPRAAGALTLAWPSLTAIGVLLVKGGLV